MLLSKRISSSALVRLSRTLVRPIPLPYIPPVKMTLMTNGMKVITEESCAGMAIIGMFIEAGARHETPHMNGVTHFFEHLAYKSFTTKTKNQFEYEVATEGMKFEVFTTREMIGFYAKCLPEGANFAIDSLADVLFESELKNQEIEDEKCAICQELIDNDENPRKLVFDYLHQTAYQGTPLSQSIEGPTRNIAKFTRELVHNYMCEQFQPWRIVIASSGGICHENILSRVEQRFGHYARNPCIDDICVPYRFSGSQVNFRNDALPLAHVAIAVEAPGLTNSDIVPMMIASSIVGNWCRSQGGGIRNGSLLARAMATTGICEYFESFYITYKDTGLWGIYFVADGKHLDEVVYNIQDQWMNLSVTTTVSEVERGKNMAKLELAKKMSGPENSCKELARQALFRRERLSMADYFQAISNIKPHAIKAVGNTYIYDKCIAVASVGPTESLPEYTRLRAGMYWLRL